MPSPNPSTIANVLCKYLAAQDAKRTVWQRLTAPRALPPSTLLVIVPLVLQILAALGITIPGFGAKTADVELDQAMRDGGLI